MSTDESMDPQSYKTYPFVVEFSGGDMDGKVLSNHSENEKEKMVAEMFLSMTNSGEPGRGIKGVSYSSILQNRVLGIVRDAESRKDAGKPITKLHSYYAIERKLVDGVYHVRVEYRVWEKPECQ